MVVLDTPSQRPASTPIGEAEPWSSPTRALHKRIQSVLTCDAFMVAMGDPDADLRPDEVLSLHGFNARTATGNASISKLTAAFGHHGSIATSKGQKGTPAWLGDFNGLIVALVEPHQPRRVWWLVLGRRASVFTAADREKATILLRAWQCEFVCPAENGLGRLLLGQDDRLILPDLSMRSRMLREPTVLDELVSNLHIVCDQRVPQLAEGESHDFVATLGKSDTWVTFRRRTGAPGSGADSHWYLEIRSSAADELPPVGAISDERIAVAVAFIHNHFADTPSLVQIAKHVHMSPFHFHRLFSKTIGTSPKQYMLRRQMQVAKWLLRARRVPISSIAAHTGFSSHGHFTSTFHRLIGVSPSEYRDDNNGR